ncbi:MAG: orotidine-5'-phosphate decarboxylase [Myxococcota bacterium]|nr:orotidine-5'-phosphate decarboxylase [Myxococcota bacterium]
MKQSPVILALDVPERARTLELAKLLGPEVGMVKLGLESFVAHGPDLVRAVVGMGLPVFLDLKLHDIPRTAAAAAKMALDLKVKLLTVHASGGAEMVRACREAVGDALHLVAVTVLTSLGDDDLAGVGFSGQAATVAARLGKLAIDSGAHGLVCSALDLPALAGIGGTRVVPGVRAAAGAIHDQKRVATPAQAMKAGATWLVVGRPILEASDPVAAARAINAELG